MTGKEYIEQRLQPAQHWYSRQADINKYAYRTLKVAEISFAIIIPALTGFMEACPVLKWVMALLALLIALMAGMQSVFRFHEQWLSFRNGSEMLKAERMLYEAKAGPYTTGPADQLLVERVEQRISAEHSAWTTTMSTDASQQPKREG